MTLPSPPAAFIAILGAELFRQGVTNAIARRKLEELQLQVSYDMMGQVDRTQCGNTSPRKKFRNVDNSNWSPLKLFQNKTLPFKPKFVQN